MLRLHVNLLLIFGLGHKFNHGVLVCTLLSLFLVENKVIENILKILRINLMLFFDRTVITISRIFTRLLKLVIRRYLSVRLCTC